MGRDDTSQQPSLSCELAGFDELLHSVHRCLAVTGEFPHTTRAGGPSGADATLSVGNPRIRSRAPDFPRGVASLSAEGRTFFTLDTLTTLLTNDDPPKVMIIVSCSMTRRAKMLATVCETTARHGDDGLLVGYLAGCGLDPALLTADMNHVFMRVLPCVIVGGRTKMRFVLVTFSNTSVEGVLAERTDKASDSATGTTARTYPCPRFKVDSCWDTTRRVCALVTTRCTHDHQPRACGSPNMILATPCSAMVVTAEGQACVTNVNWRTVDALSTERARTYLALLMQRLASSYRELTGATVSLTQLAWRSIAYLCTTALAMQHSTRPLPFTRVAG